MKLIAFFLSASVILLFDSPCLADGFSDPVDHDNIRFSQYQTEEFHQEPVISPDGNTLAYINVEGGDVTKRRLWVMDADGENQRPLVVDPVPHIQAYPRWSPDGSYIAYVSNRGGATGVWIVAVNGGKPRKLNQGHLGRAVFLHAAAWSPDSRRLVVDMQNATSSFLISYDLEGSPPDTLLSASEVLYPTWSADGEKICFNGKSHSTGNFWSFSVRDGSVDPIYSAGILGFFGLYSPDSRWIAFQADPGPQIYVMPAVGGQPFSVSEPALFEGARTVSWGNDSRTLFFSGHPRPKAGMQEHVAIMDTSGAGLRVIASFDKLKDVGPTDATLSWSPDERTLAFTTLDTTIVFINIDSGELQNVVKGKDATFSPDGREIAYEHNGALWATALDAIDPYPLTLARSNEVGSGTVNTLGLPMWSPDGEWIVYRQRNTLWEVSAYGGEPRPLLKEQEWAFPVGWVDSTYVFIGLRTGVTSDVLSWGSIANLKMENSSEPQWLRSNPGWGTDVASDRSFFVTVEAGLSSNLIFFDEDDQKLMPVEDFPDHQVRWPSLSPSNNQVAFFLRRSFFTHTWRADISDKLEQDGPLP